MSSKKINGPVCIDLFAGCGGLSLGLEEAGFTPLLVNELNSDAMETYLLNREKDFPWLREKYNVKDVKTLVNEEGLLRCIIEGIERDTGIDIENGELDLLAGGPPCQGYSGIGHRRSYAVDKKHLPSNYLYQDMAFLVARLKPKIFLFENVRGLLSARWSQDSERKGEIWQHVVDTFHEYCDGKYSIRAQLVYAKDYGVPQNRPRVLMVGVRKNLGVVLPEVRDATSKRFMNAVADGLLPDPVEVDDKPPGPQELLGDLVDPNYEPGLPRSPRYSEKALTRVQRQLRTTRDGHSMRKGGHLTEQDYSRHSGRVVAKFSAMIKSKGEIPEEYKTKKFAQRWLPPSWGSNGPMITATSLPDDYVHFSQPRILTVREWARLQMFPDWYEFAGKRTTGGTRRAGNPHEQNFEREVPKYTQIGNAVPVKLAYEVGKHFNKILR